LSDELCHSDVIWLVIFSAAPITPVAYGKGMGHIIWLWWPVRHGPQQLQC